MPSIKNIFSYLILLLILLSCSKEENFAPEQIACEPTDLNIDEAAKRLLQEDEVFFVGDTVWQWKLNGNNLEIKFRYGCGDECSTVRKLQFLIRDECVILTRDLKIRSDFFGGTDVHTNEINFELQEFNNERIIGKNFETEFWVEFSEPNRYN